MGVVTMASKHYSSFLRELWCGLGPLCASQLFVDAVGEVRNSCEENMLALNPPAFEQRHAPDVAKPFVLMERYHAYAPTRAVYGDIMTTLGLPNPSEFTTEALQQAGE